MGLARESREREGLTGNTHTHVRRRTHVHQTHLALLCTMSIKGGGAD